MPLSVSSNPHIAQTEPSKSNPYESVKHFGRKTLRWLGINQPPSLKALTETVKRQSETIQGQRSLSARVVDNLTGKAGNPFRSLSDKLAKNEAKLAVRSDPANFDQNKIEDIGFLLRDKTDEEIKEYFDKVPKHQVDRAIMKLAKTAKEQFGDDTKEKLDAIYSWAGNGNRALGEKIWNQMLAKPELKLTTIDKDGKSVPNNDQALDTKRAVLPLPLKKKVGFTEDSIPVSVKPTDQIRPKSKLRQQAVRDNIEQQTVLQNVLQESVQPGRRSKVGTIRIQGKPRALGQGGVNQVYTDGKWALKREESMPKQENSERDVAGHDCAGLLQVPASKPNALGRNLAFYELNCLFGKGKATVALEVKAGFVSESDQPELYQAMEMAKGTPSNGRPISCEIGNPELLEKYEANKDTIKSIMDKKRFPSQNPEEALIDKKRVLSQDPEEALYYTMMYHYNEFKSSDGAHGTRLDAYFEKQGLGRGAKYNEDEKSFTFEVFDNHKSKVATGERVDCTNKFIEERIDWNDPKLQNLSEDLQLMCIISCQQDFNTGNYFLDVNSQGKCNNLQAIDRDFGFFENFEAVDKLISAKVKDDQLTKQLENIPITKKDAQAILQKLPHQRTAKENVILKKLFAEAYLSDRDIRTKIQLPLKITAETYKKYTQAINPSVIETICKESGLDSAAAFATNALLEKVQDHIGKMEPVKNDKNEIIAWQVKGYNESDKNRQNNLLLEIKENMLNQSLRLDENNKPYLYDLPPESK